MDSVGIVLRRLLAFHSYLGDKHLLVMFYFRKILQRCSRKCLLCSPGGSKKEIWEGDRRVECWSHFIHSFKWSTSFLGR